MRQSSRWLASVPVLHAFERSLGASDDDEPGVPSETGSETLPPVTFTPSSASTSTTMIVPAPPPTAIPRPPPMPRRSWTWPVSRRAPGRNFMRRSFPCPRPAKKAAGVAERGAADLSAREHALAVGHQRVVVVRARDLDVLGVGDRLEVVARRPVVRLTGLVVARAVWAVDSHGPADDVAPVRTLAAVVRKPGEQRIGPEPRIQTDEARGQPIGVHAPDPDAGALEFRCQVVPRQPVRHSHDLLARRGRRAARYRFLLTVRDLSHDGKRTSTPDDLSAYQAGR